MKTEVEILLTDEFVAFSKKIASLHAQRKQCYEEFKQKMAEFDTKADDLNDEFQKWKKEQMAS